MVWIATTVAAGSRTSCRNAALLLGLAAVLFSLASFRRTWTVLDYDLLSAKCFQALNAAGSAGTVRGGSSGGGGGSLFAVADHPTNTKSTNQHNNVDHLVTKRSGKGWEVWDRESVLHEELGDKGTGSPCNWQEYKAVGRRYNNGVGAGGKSNASNPTDRDSRLPPVFMCLYPRTEDRWVSGLIETKGKWGNCDTLTRRLKGSDRDADTKGMVYMDVGANIGSCVVQILATTDAKVVAFEPNPKNLFRLTSTLMNLPEQMKNRVTLFPVALGSEPSGSATIVSNPNNAGNTQVVQASSTSAEELGVAGATVATHNIPVERMDDLLSKDLKVDLLKLDVQGFECFVLAGMEAVLRNTRKIFFEVEEQLLTRFRGTDGTPGTACSGPLLVRAIQRSGFVVHLGPGLVAEDLTARPDAGLADVKLRNQDMFAEKKMNWDAGE
jgi:FkbM family methyltransferase